MAESWAMSEALVRNMPMPVAMGILLKGLLGVSTGEENAQKPAPTTPQRGDDADEDDRILRAFSR